MTPRVPLRDGPDVLAFGDACSSHMRHAFRLSRLYAKIRRPVLLLGPVGAGKTSLARALHRWADRPGDFVPVSAGELTETLYADTLFGHKAGAFTGATTAQEGVFDRSANGTLLLDDLALMPRAVQAAILRVLESGGFRPLGSLVDKTAACRFAFASTAPLDELVESGALLPDLRSRIGELVIWVPPLSSRRDDILPLASAFASAFVVEHGRTGDVSFSDDARGCFLGYPWPGNVRELKAVIERAIVHAGLSDSPTTVRLGHLPDRFQEPFDAPAELPMLTRSLVESVLFEAGGNRSEAARRLGVHRNTIGRWAKTAG